MAEGRKVACLNSDLCAAAALLRPESWVESTPREGTCNVRIDDPGWELMKVCCSLGGFLLRALPPGTSQGSCASCVDLPLTCQRNILTARRYKSERLVRYRGEWAHFDPSHTQGEKTHLKSSKEDELAP